MCAEELSRETERADILYYRAWVWVSAEVYTLIVDVYSVPYGALTLSLDTSVYCRLDFRLGKDNADIHRDNKTLAVLENATSRLLVRWWDRCIHPLRYHMLLGGVSLVYSTTRVFLKFLLTSYQYQELKQ